MKKVTFLVLMLAIFSLTTFGQELQTDGTISPEEAVKAMYTYLKVREMEEGYNLLSDMYQDTNLEEWAGRFKNVLDVDVISIKLVEETEDVVFVKFLTKNWVDTEVETHYYEGTWQTIFENGVYKMLKSKIVEVEDPDYIWFYQ
jgi:hypothetical protein